MPGLVGIVSDRPMNPELIEAMAEPMRHRPTYRVRVHRDKLFAVSTIDLAAGRQADMAQSADGQTALSVFGTIYESWASRGAGLAAELLTRWEKGGPEALTDLNGEYLIVIWERTDQRLTVVNDRLGLKRLAIWHNETMFAWASEVKSLAVIPEVSREIDEQALAELLTFGHLQDDRTLLRDVKLLPPATVLTWQRGRLSVNRYWQYTFQADSGLENTERASQEYAERVRTAVSRRIEGLKRVGVLLSGGLDSRTLAGMVRKLRPQGTLLSWTTGHAHAHDVRFGRQIAKTVGSRHTFLPIPESFLQEFAPEYAWVLDGMVTAHGAHRSCVLEPVSRETDVTLIGFLGDVLSGDKPLHPHPLGLSRLEDILETGYRHYAVGFDDALFAKTLRPVLYRRMRGLAREAFARSIRKAQVEHPADRVVWTELMQRQRLWNPLSQMDLMGIDCHVGTPFTDKEFVDFALRLPMSQRIEKRAYIGMICREFPKLARVPRSGDGLPLLHSRLHASLHWRWVLFERHILPKLTGGRMGGHLYGPYVHCSEWFRSASRRFIEATLINNPILEEHFQMDALNKLVRSFLENTAERDLMECIAALMSYVLFREKLDSVTTCPLSQQEACLR